MADFTSRSQSFLRWFRALEGAAFHKDLEICDLRTRGAGRGVVATADIEPDEVLFTIPRRAVISSDTCELVSKLPDVFGADEHRHGSPTEHEQDTWSRLMLVLAFEFLRGAASPWKPYLDMLPDSFDTLMSWSPDELAQLQTSCVVARIGQDEADAMIRANIIPVMRRNGELFAGSEQMTDENLLCLARRMGSIIMAYAFDLERDDAHDGSRATDDDGDGWVEDRDGRVMIGMVPMADMLNADAEFNAHINHGERALEATALRRITAGEEILNYYGPLSNGELLRRYGYVTDRHARHDVVELPWVLVESQLKRLLSLHDRDWANVKKQVELDDIEDGFVLERECEEPDSNGHLHDAAVFRHLPDELREQFKAYVKAIKQACPSAASALSDKTRREALYLDVVLGAVQAHEKSYATTLEEDQRLLDGGFVTGRLRMAVVVRRGEKRLLREAQVWLREQMDGNAARETAREPASEPAAKRQRRV